jgi:hypothetical protein
MASERDKAERVFAALNSARVAEPKAALALLNGLMDLVRSDGGGDDVEVDEARSSAFLAICEVGKALHRGQPAEPPWAAAIAATERWLSIAR